MPRGRARLSDIEFFERTLGFSVEHGTMLKEIHPECVDKYQDHSLFKLLCINYWIGFFLPITHKNLREKKGLKIAYVDPMAGSGVTISSREGDCFCGSSPSALLSAKRNPFDIIITNDIDKQKVDVLQERLESIVDSDPTALLHYNDDIINVSYEIAEQIGKKTISYVVIDPEALRGLKWKAIKPLLCCSGDAMITFFSLELWRLKQAATSDVKTPQTASQFERINELMGNCGWEHTKNQEDLISLFAQRIIDECGKKGFQKIKIPRQGGDFYMLLFVGNDKTIEKAKEWKKNIERRMKSRIGNELSILLDIKAKRRTSLDQFQ